MLRRCGRGLFGVGNKLKTAFYWRGYRTTVPALCGGHWRVDDTGEPVERIPIFVYANAFQIKVLSSKTFSSTAPLPSSQAWVLT